LRRPPPISAFPRYPVTAGTALLAIGLTLAWWGKVDMSGIVDNALITRGQIWRLLSSTLLHVNVIHLAFNLCWLWIFGTKVEEEFGTIPALGIFALLGLSSSAAEFAIFEGGVGLSGINYGLFGMLWVLSRRDSRFSDSVDARTIQLMVVWFFICIATTITGVLGVANIAHGMGALLGAMLGWTISSPRGNTRSLRVTALASSVVALLVAAIILRPYLNLAPQAGMEEAVLGYEALEQNRFKQAAHWYRDATLMAPKNADNWYGLGFAYHKLKDYPHAAEAYARAARLAPQNHDYRVAAEAMNQYVRAATPPS
jgi:membrane associated rhomboid family serine protease